MKNIILKLYKHRFSDNWHIEVGSNIYCPPDNRFWTKCLRNITMSIYDAERLFGHYLNKGSFEISNDFYKSSVLQPKRL